MRTTKLLILGCIYTVGVSYHATAQATNAPKPTQPAPAAIAKEARSIRFQFDGIPYADVLERFAQTANKPLVTDTNIQGTLTYNDPQPYTYQEALDTLNVMLSMKGAMLVEDGHYLRLVPVKQLPQIGLKILRGLDQTGDVRPGEVVTVVLDVKNLDAKEVGDAIISMLSNAGSVAPLSRGRGLIITDRLANIQRIKTLLSAIDNETVSNRQMKAFTLLHSSGAVVADLINRTFGIATAPKRTQYNPNNKALEVLPPDPNDYITAVFDDASRTLVLFGPRDRIGLAEELISKFEDKEGGGEVRIYQPQVTKAEELAQMIRQAIPGVAAPGETAATAATKARVIADNALNRLIVAAPVAGQLDQIEQLINRLDKPVHGSGGANLGTRSQTVQITKVFRPRSSDAVSVAKILTEALSKRLPSGQTVTTANVTVEPNSHSVVVTGSPAEVQTAVDIITQLETGSSTPTPQQTKFIDVGGIAEAKRLLPLIEQIYRSQVTDSLGGQVAHAKMIADVDSGRLIVTASDDHLKRIDGIVTQLRTQNIKAQTRRVHTIAPKHARVDGVFSSINSMVVERMTDKRFEDSAKPMLVADNANNRILVTGTEDQIKEIEQVVNLFDVAPEKMRREMVVIPAHSKSANDLIALTTQLIAQLGEEQANPQLAPKLIPDGKQIIVLAAAKDMERITNLVQQLDTASTAVTGRQFKGVDLTSRNATELTPLVQQLYSEQLKGQSDPAGGAATLIADARNNRIMVSGSDREIQRVETIIRQLDPHGVKPAREETRVVRLKNALAADLAALVEKSVNVQSQKLRVLVDQRSNSLVLNGDSTAVDAAAQVIAQLDTRAETQPREMRIIELKQGDATTVGPMVTSVFTEMVKDQRGPDYVPQTKIVSDPAANRLIVTGPKEELDTVANVVQQLDQLPETAGGARVFKLLMADAATVAPVVSNAMVRFDVRNNQPIRRVTVSADRESNSIIVAGSRTDLQDAEKIIERLDHEGEKGRSLKVVEINTDDADALAGLAMKVFTAQNTGRNIASIVSITPEPSGKRLILLAPESMVQQIESVITMLDTKPEQGNRELHVVEIKGAAAQEVLPTVNRIYGEQTQGKSAKPATIYPDTSGGRLMVYGTKDQAAAIRQIVATVEGQGRPPREMRSFEIGAATEVQRLLPLLQQLYQEQWKGKTDAADAQFVVDAPGGRLIVSGKPDHLAMIESILKQLNSGKPRSDARDTRVFDLTTANSMELATTVRTLYTEQSKNRLGAAVADTLILPDATANRLVISGDTNELVVIEEIIRKLDKVSAQSASTRVFKLKSAEPDKVSEILSTALVRYDAYGRPQKRVSVVVDAKSRTIIATGDPKDLQGASVIIEQLDSLGAQPERKMRVVALKAGRVGDLGGKVRQLYQDQAKAQPELGVTDPLIIEDSGSNQLVLAGSDGQLQLIENILSQLQTPQTTIELQETRVYDLAAASASELVSTVRSLYQEQSRARPNATLNPALILPDVAANRIVVSAVTNELQLIEDIIKRLDKANVQAATTRVFKLKSGSADQVASVLSTSLAKLDANGRSVPRVTVGADARSNLVIVSGDAKDLQAAASIVEQFDGTASEARQMKFIPVKTGTATDFATKLRQLYLDHMKGKNQTATADALVMGDDLANRLIIAASESHMKVIEEVAKQLQDAGEGSGRQIQVVSLKHISASPVATMISQLFSTQVGSSDPAQKLVVTASPDDRTLLVDANAPTLDRIQQLIGTLDRSETNGQAIIQTVHLKKATADSLAEAVTQAIATRGAQPRLKQVSVTPVSGANALLLNGPGEAVQEVMKIVQELDRESTGGEIEVRIYKLKSAEAKDVVPVLNQLLQSLAFRNPRSEGRRFLSATIAVDERSNSLLVSATPAHFHLVEQLLPTLDQAPERSDRDVHFVWLKNAKAWDVVGKLSAVFEGRQAGDRPVIESDAFSNSLTVIAKRSDIAQIQELVERLDASTKDTSLQVRLRPLDRVPAEQMARMLKNIYPQMSAGNIRITDKLPVTATNAPVTNAAPEVVIAVDKDANVLLLSGPTQDLDQIDRIISELSYSGISGDAELRIFSLKEADPIVVARTLNQLFRTEQAPRQDGPAQGQPQPQQPQPPGAQREPKMTVVAEPRTRSIIVRAKPTEFTLLESLVKQLDAPGMSPQLSYRLVRLTNAPPEQLVPLVQQMVTHLRVLRPGDPLTVSADSRSQSLLIVAQDSALNQLEQIIHSLDTPSPFSEAEVLVVSLKKTAAPQVAAVLQSMLRPGARGEANARAVELQEQVRRLKIQDDQGKTILLDLSKPIKVLADPVSGGNGGNRLILSSTPENLKALAAVVEMMDTVPLTEGVSVRIVRLLHADASSVLQTLNSVFQQGSRLAVGPAGVAQPAGDPGKALVNPLNVALDSRANALILSGRQESLDLAGKIIDELDKKIERFVTEVKLFRMKHASALRLAPLLQSVFAEGPAVPGTEGLNTQITRLRAALEPEKPQLTETPKARSALIVQADDTSNILIVAARTDTLPLIEAVVNQLDIPSASGLDSVRIYPLQHADAVTFQKVVNDIFTGPRAAQLRNEDKPNITIDERTQALIVAGNSKALAIIDNLLAQLDKPLPLELRDVRILPLQHADALDLAANLQRLLDARVTQRGTLSKQQSDAMRVLVVGEPRSNSILLAGSKDSFELVESLAKELDKAPTALSGKIRLVPLAYADARHITAALLNLFAQRYQAAKSPEVQRNKPVIVPDPRSNGLLIAAGVDDNAVIDELLQKLDRKLEDPALALTFIPLKHNDSSRIASTLENVFAARLKARTAPGQESSPQDQVEIETDSLNNALIVSANKDNLEVLKGLLEKLDAQPEIAGGILQTFPLQFADAQRVASMLQTLVQQGLYRPGMPASATSAAGTKRDSLAVAVDRRSNTLIVSASPENLAVIREIIKQVDTKDYAEKTNIRLYSLKHAKASSLATVLEQFFRAKQAGDSVAVNSTERAVPVAVIPDDRANTLLVTGGKESFDILDRVVAQLDGEDAMSRMNFRVFPLKQTTAGKLQETLQKLFVNRPPRTKGEPADPITVVADPWVNALLVGASVDDMSMVTSLIERLDSTQAQLGLTVQVFPLGKADARRVAQTVQGLYRDNTPGVSSAYPVLVTADERLNAIVVSAGEADLKRIGDLIKKLDTDNVARVSEIRVFGLKYARAESLATILNTSLNTKPTQLSDMNPNSASVLQFIARSEKGTELVTSALKEGVLITPDARMNSLIVSAPVDYMDLLEQIITRLDSGLPQQAKVKVFTLVNADARQMAELLLALFRLQPQQGGVGQNAPQRSIEYTLVKANGNASQGNVAKARTISTHGNSDVTFDEHFIGPLPEEEAVASATIGTAEQSALNVTVDPRTNSLLVGGTEDYVLLVSEVINSLDASPGQERHSEVYRLKNAMATEVQAAIRSFLDQEKQRVTQVLGQDAVGTAQRLLEQEVAIVAEESSNALLLSANPRYFKQIMDLIEELDQPQPQVLIQVLLAEVSLDATRDLGIEWNLGGRIGGADLLAGTDFGFSRLLPSVPPNMVPGALPSTGLPPSSGFSAAVTGDDFSFLLRALENEGRLEVLSRPQILTADNRPASVNIGQRVPVVTDSRVTDQNAIINSIRYESVGINLSVTPRIGPDGSVKMDVSTTNSALSSSTIPVSERLAAPIINERRATTTVSVQSGQSILIGGLISTVDDKRIRKIPFLGDIPYLGELFRSTRKNMERRELLILLTPQVLINVRATAKTMDLDEMTDRHLRESTLQDQFQKDAVKDRLLQPLIRNGTNAPNADLPRIPGESRPAKKDDEI